MAGEGGGMKSSRIVLTGERGNQVVYFLFFSFVCFFSEFPAGLTSQ